MSALYSPTEGRIRQWLNTSVLILYLLRSANPNSPARALPRSQTHPSRTALLENPLKMLYVIAVSRTIYESSKRIVA